MEKVQFTVHQKLEIGLLSAVVVLQFLIFLRMPGKAPTFGELRASKGESRRELLSRRPLVYVDGSVEVPGTVDVRVSDAVDVNLKQLMGYDFVSSEKGMFIGIESANKTIIPIHWGEVTVVP
jgi:hypothetical protein